MSTLEQALTVLAATPAQARELQADPARAQGWIDWARHHSKGIGAVLAQYRTGETAPDIDAWYAEDGSRETPAKHGPDHPTLLRTADHLIRHTGHELLEQDIDDELDRLERHPKIGNGAQLSRPERERLHALAATLRERHQAGQPERDQHDQATIVASHLRLLAEQRVTRKHALHTIVPRLRAAGHTQAADAIAAAAHQTSNPTP